MEAKRNSILMIVLILCTITIIWTNYTFSKQVVININKAIIEREYKKIWWKENYMILQEIQKREILWYIDKIKEEQPELIKNILENKIESTNDYKVLNKNIINDLKKDAFIKWNSWALVTIIEFSDLECPFCIKSHKEWVNEKVLENYSDKVNLIFKNFPLPAHKNAQIEAEASKCVQNIAWWEKYLEYIDSIFSNTKWGWEWFKMKELNPLAEKLWINNKEFKTCLTNWDSKDQVEREFKQWAMLWINSVPSNLILNNKTWKYIIVSKVIDYKNMEKLIEEISR